MFMWALGPLLLKVADRAKASLDSPIHATQLVARIAGRSTASACGY